MNITLNRLFTLAYIASAEKVKVQTAKELFSLPQVFDPGGYYAGLNLKGINVQKNKLIIENVLSQILTMQTYHNIWGITRYLKDAERTTPPLWLEAGSIRITPPFISNYFTPEGGFYNAILFVRKAEFPLLELQAGIDTGFLSDAKLDCLRLGGKMHDLPLISRVSLSPYAFVNVGKAELEYKGVCIGTDVQLDLRVSDASRVSLVGTCEYSKNDVLENIIKREKDGFNFSLALGISF